MSSASATGWLRVYFEENAYTTVPATSVTSAAAICALMMRKRGVQLQHQQQATPHALFVTDAQQEDVFERRMADDERPLEVQEKIRKGGNLDHFRIVFKPANSPAAAESSSRAGSAHSSSASPSPPDPMQSSSSMFDDADSESTPLDASVPSTPSSASRPPRTLLQPSLAQVAMAADPQIMRCGYLEKRGKRNTAWKERWFVIKQGGLHYYKSHGHGAAIASIPLVDAFVRAAHTNCQGGVVPPFTASPSITNLTQSPALPTPHSHSSLSKCSYELEIHTVLRVFFLRAQSYPEMLNWVTDIRRLIAECVDNTLLDSIGDLIEAAEVSRATDEEQRIAAIMTLPGLLANSIAIEQFVQFETERRAERHVLAYLDCESFQRAAAVGVKSASQITERAKAIVANYLLPASPQRISSVPESVRAELVSAVEKGDTRRDLFLPLRTAAFAHLEEFSFLAFVQSKHFQRAMLKLSQLGAQQSATDADASAVLAQATSHVRQASSFPVTAFPVAQPPRDDFEPTPLMARNASESKEDSAAGAASSAGEDPTSVDVSHSISDTPAAAPANGGSLLAALYTGGSAAGVVVGAGQPSGEVSPADALQHPQAPVRGSPAPLSSKNMSPAALAAYLESIGAADAKQRSTSTAQAAAAASNSVAALPASSTAHGAGGDSDTDESETEEKEEDGMFGNTPGPARSILDDSSGYSTPAKSNSAAKQSVSSASFPVTATMSADELEDDSFFTASRSRSTASVVTLPRPSASAAAKPPPGSTLKLPNISELNSRDTPSTSVADPSTRPRQNEEGSISADTIDPALVAATAASSTSQPRVSSIHPSQPTEPRRRSSALVHSASSADAAATPAKAAAVVAAANSSSKWKKSSIFDVDDESPEPVKPSSSPATKPAASLPPPAAATTATPGASPAIKPTAATIDLAALQDGSVDVGDLNLDL